MIDWSEWAQRVPLAKWSIILIFSILGAIMQRDMTWPGRALAFVIGIMAAVVFAEPVCSLLNLDQSYSTAIAAVLAMTGRNWAAYVVRASHNPTRAIAELLDIWRKR
ncbi:MULTISPECIES: hypothetical protein [unclassified Brucella]|uniref:hypothetical protein n=1 Tax=unclassified Brucella TaxID=2632610 RepID=UPI001FFE7F6D|nr:MULTISPECIES: hypothetical protein [unclassified Brucella]